MIFWFFFSFFGIFYYLSGKNGMERQFLFFLSLGFFQPILAWNEVITVSFNLLNFFAILFWIFSYASGRNETKRNDNFYFPSLSLFPTCLAWNDAIIVFFNFLNFFAIFLEFSIAHRVGRERNDNFYFLSSLAFSNLFWLQMTP